MSTPPAPFLEVSVQEFQQRLEDAARTLQLIDVREPQEVAIAALPGFLNFPLSQHETWTSTLAQTLDPQAETYVLCHHGMRSAQMCAWLTQQGFTSVANIVGGIDAYALVVNSNIPRY